MATGVVTLNLKELWAELTTGTGQPSQTNVFRKLVDSTVCDAFIGIDRIRGQRYFAIDSSSFDATPVMLPSPNGFQVLISKEAVTRSREALYLILEDDTFSNEFDALINEVIHTSNQSSNPANAVPDVIETVRRWQRFLEVVRPDGLSENAQLGLAGELMIIRDYLAPGLGMGQAILAWKGPLRDSKDIQASNSAAEIKTTVQAKPQSIRISSEFQLDDDGLEKLFLLHNSVERTHDSGESLPELVGDLAGLAQEAGVTDYLARMLFEAGYHVIHEHHYSAVFYRNREINALEVSPLFPRLIESDLPDGVGGLNYSISLEQCLQFKVDRAQVIEALKV